MALLSTGHNSLVELIASSFANFGLQQLSRPQVPTHVGQHCSR
jgi:hypothetical protein